MKVICVNDGRQDGRLRELENGQTYEVEPHIGSCPHSPESYRVQGMTLPTVCRKCGMISGVGVYAQSRFVPISDIDETDYADEVLEKMFEPIKIQQ